MKPDALSDSDAIQEGVDATDSMQKDQVLADLSDAVKSALPEGSRESFSMEREDDGSITLSVNGPLYEGQIVGLEPVRAGGKVSAYKMVWAGEQEAGDELWEATKSFLRERSMLDETPVVAAGVRSDIEDRV
jgi:hypothetical protein